MRSAPSASPTSTCRRRPRSAGRRSRKPGRRGPGVAARARPGPSRCRVDPANKVHKSGNTLNDRRHRSFRLSAHFIFRADAGILFRHGRGNKAGRFSCARRQKAAEHNAVRRSMPTLCCPRAVALPRCALGAATTGLDNSDGGGDRHPSMGALLAATTVSRHSVAHLTAPRREFRDPNTCGNCAQSRLCFDDDRSHSRRVTAATVGCSTCSPAPRCRTMSTPRRR